MSVRDLEGFVSSVGKDMNPFYALWFAKNNPDCDIGKYQEIACRDATLAYYFAVDIPESNVEFCHGKAGNKGKWAIEDYILEDIFHHI